MTKSIGIEFTSENVMFSLLEKLGIVFIQSDSEPNVCEANVTDEQEAILLKSRFVRSLSEL